MTLVKHSQRTIRKPCKGCGSLDLYWAHDTDNADSAMRCEQCNVTGKFVLMDQHGNAHFCPGAKQGNTGSPVPASNGNGAAHAVPGDDKLATAAALLDALSPKVDAAEVQRLIAAQHDDYA